MLSPENFGFISASWDINPSKYVNEWTKIQINMVIQITKICFKSVEHANVCYSISSSSLIHGKGITCSIAGTSSVLRVTCSLQLHKYHQLGNIVLIWEHTVVTAIRECKLASQTLHMTPVKLMDPTQFLLLLFLGQVPIFIPQRSQD